MKYDNARAFVVCMVLSCTPKAMDTTTPEPAASQKTTQEFIPSKEKAIAAATKYVRGEKLDSLCFLDSVTTFENRESWTVSFKKVDWYDPKGPMIHVEVDKTTGRAGKMPDKELRTAPPYSIDY